VLSKHRQTVSKASQVLTPSKNRLVRFTPPLRHLHPVYVAQLPACRRHRGDLVGLEVLASRCLALDFRCFVAVFAIVLMAFILGIVSAVSSSQTPHQRCTLNSRQFCCTGYRHNLLLGAPGPFEEHWSRVMPIFKPA